MKTQKTNARVLSEKMGLKGCLRWTVFHHNEEGLLKLKELKTLLAEGKITAEERSKRRQMILENPLYSKIKTRELSFFERLRGVSPLMAGVNHNIVTDEGDALIADIMAETPAKTKVDNTNGHIAVGTGYVSELKSVLACVTPTGSPEEMDALYPKLKGTFGNADDNVTQYRSIFEAGDLNDTGIDEASLGNNAAEASAEMLAYAQITPTVDVTTADTLQVDWEMTYTGA